MAKVTMPLLSGEVHGKVGDIVFFKRYGEQLARMRVIPTNPKTAKQMIVRNNLSGLSKIWKGEGGIKLKKYDVASGNYVEITVATGLTDTEKSKWVNLATQKGKPSIYGRLLFIGENIRRLLSGLDFRREPA
jgi:hypothetical protein